MLSACGEVPTRQCPEFYHPVASRWMPSSAGSTVKFKADNGETVLYRLSSAWKNKPYTEGDESAQSAGDILCKLSQSLTYTSDALDHSIKFTFIQSEDLTIEPMNQYLSLQATVSRIDDKPLPYQFNWFLSSLEDNERVDRKSVSTYSERREIDGHLYTHALEETKLSTSAAHELASEPTLAIVRMVLADGIGLQQFELSSGRVYTNLQR